VTYLAWNAVGTRRPYHEVDTSCKDEGDLSSGSTLPDFLRGEVEMRSKEGMDQGEEMFLQRNEGWNKQQVETYVLEDLKAVFRYWPCWPMPTRNSAS
jgi:hypothetical protein